jgi:hypothetical protein
MGLDFVHNPTQVNSTSVEHPFYPAEVLWEIISQLSVVNCGKHNIQQTLVKSSSCPYRLYLCAKGIIQKASAIKKGGNLACSWFLVLACVSQSVSISIDAYICPQWLGGWI